jgi:hypothetical protein
MSYDNLSGVSQNVLKFHQQLTGEERGSLSFLTIFTFAIPELLDLICRKIKTLLIVPTKNERDPPLLPSQ